MSGPRVVVAVGARSAEWVGLLRAEMPGATVTTADDPTVDPATIDYLLIWRAPVDLLDRATSLRGILLIGAGYDHLVPAALPDVPLVRLIDPAMADDIALYVLAWVVHFQRDFDHFAAAQHEGRWDHDRPVRMPHDVTVGVLGAGEIGRVVLDTCAAHGFRTVAWSRSSHDRPLLAFFADCDVVVDLVPLNDAARGLVGAAELAALGDGVLVNVGRGATVDTGALLEALDCHLRAAVLDVFDTEPLPHDSPLWSHPRVHVTPHVAGRTDHRTAAPVIASSIRTLEAGGTPHGLVTFDR